MSTVRNSFATICTALLITSAAPAQTQLTPRINHLMPMGGQAGTTVDLRVYGSDLADIEGLHFNFPGVKVESGGTEALTPPDGKKKGKGGGKGMAGQGLTAHRFKVTLPADAPLGIQDVRIVTKAGISNPRAFVVSDHKEFTELEPNDDVPKAQRIEINSTVNGAINTPTDVDYYVFAGRKGQRVVGYCATSSIDSRLTVGLECYGPDNSKLAANRNYDREDALIDMTLPADGDYFIRVASFDYTQGGVDRFYRLTVTTAPWIDAVFPPTVQPGKDGQLTVYGRNLPGGQVDPTAIVGGRGLEKVVVAVKAPADANAWQRLAFSGYVSPVSSMLDGFDYRLKNPSGQSNPFLLTYAHAQVVLDNGDNDTLEKAQKVPVPCVIAGRFEKKSDRDWYAFTVKKGQVLDIEAFGERLGSPLDLILQIRDDKGNAYMELDDSAEVLSPQFFTSHTDPLRYRFVAPSDGTFHLVMMSRYAATEFGPRHLYTVRVTAEEPDFRLIAMPTSPLTPEGNTLNQGGAAAFNVYVWRLGGFSGDIILQGDRLPMGIDVKPQIIGAGQKQGVVIVHSEAEAQPWTGAINLVGTATIKGQKVKREVRGATMIWPVAAPNIPTLTRLDRELVVAVRDKGPFTLALGSDKVSVVQGQKISIPVKVVGTDKFKTSVQVAAFGGPAGLIQNPTTIAPGAGGNVSLDAKGGQAFPPGIYTIYLKGQTQPINPKNPQPPKAGGPPNLVQVSLPITLTIAPKQLGKLTATPTSAKVALGKEVVVTVRLARQFELPLPLTVAAILPANMKGVTVKDATIDAEGTEAKLTFMVAPDAQIAAGSSVTIRATAVFNESVPVVHETKFTLSAAK